MEEEKKGGQAKRSRLAEGGQPGGADSREEGERFTYDGDQEIKASSSREGFSEGGVACLPEGSCTTTIHSFASFSELLTWAWDVLKTLRLRLRMQLTTAKVEDLVPSSSDDIFPLPTSQAVPNHVNSVVAALNDLAGHGPLPCGEDTSDSSWVVQKNVAAVVGKV